MIAQRSRWQSQILVVALLGHSFFFSSAGAAELTRPSNDPIIGLYVHQHWSYKHPYAARTWSQNDWNGYLTGLTTLGYNTVLIWPVLETMPNPLTTSDRENLDKIRQVIDFAHEKLGMRVYIALCPNVAALDEEAAKYTFVDRPFFHCDQRVNPADAVEMGKMIAWRLELLEPLKDMDGVFIIDSDPGGYPGSNNLEFVNLLKFHRTAFDSLRPGIELYYWAHVGWEAYCRFYSTANFVYGPKDEVEDAVKLLAKMNPEPWGVASQRGSDLCDAIGMADRVLPFQYGAIEGEPSFPMTGFGSAEVFARGSEVGARGVFGNAQTHCVQLPNTFAFVCAAHGKRTERTDYVAFANRLIPGKGEVIVQGWEALKSADTAEQEEVIERLESLSREPVSSGDLGGLLLGDPRRFVNDLVMMLRMKSTLNGFRSAALKGVRGRALGDKMLRFVNAADTWQTQHGYKGNWVWPEMEETLLKVDQSKYEAFFAQRNYKGEGATPLEQVQNGYKRVETYTPRLIQEMRTSAEMLLDN